MKLALYSVLLSYTLVLKIYTKRSKLFIHVVLCMLIMRQRRGFNFPDHVSANKEEDKKNLLA
jgi:hypothetical protein